MAQFYVPRYDTGSGNPWAGAASAYGNELDRLGSLQQQGMQDTSQLPMKLYQSFLQGYQDQQAQAQAEADFQMKQDQIDRMNRMADLQQQKADEAEAFRRDQLKQRNDWDAQKLITDTHEKMLTEYRPELRPVFKANFERALQMKGLGATEASASAENFLPPVTETKYESKVHPEDGSMGPSGWDFKIGNQPIGVQSAQDAMAQAPGEEWAFSPGSVQEDRYLGSKIVEAGRKEARDAQIAAYEAARMDQARAESERKERDADKRLAAMLSIAAAKQNQNQIMDAGSIQDLAQRLITGKEPWPTGRALTDPDYKAALALARQIDPEFNASTSKQREKTQNAFTNGTQGQSIAAMNTAIQHLQEWLTSINSLNNTSVPSWNSIKNKALEETGDQRVKAADTSAKTLADELTRAYRGSGGAEADIQAQLANLSRNQSPAQAMMTAKTLVKLLKGRELALQSMYKQGMGRFGNLDVFSPEAKSAIDALLPPESGNTQQQGDFSVSYGGKVYPFKNKKDSDEFKAQLGIQ